VRGDLSDIWGSTTFGRTPKIIDMKIANTMALLEILKSNPTEGLQISRKSGILNSTKCAYYKEPLFFLFAMEDDFDFSPSNGYTLQQFLELYEHDNWIIEMAIG